MQFTMLTHEYSYEACLRGSVTKPWTVDDCFQGRDFDFSKPFLPDRIAGVNAIGCLTAHEKRMLNQIRGNSYCHIFAFVEEYIVPLVMDRALSDVYGDETRLRSLVRFADEELKHQEMLRRAVEQFGAGFAVSCGLVPGREEVARVVLDTSPLTALLLTSMIEWFTQLHYTEHVQEDAELDELFRDILRFHWIDESRHARMDSLLIDEVAGDLTADQREQAVDQLLELGGAVDGLLGNQIELDIDALRRASGHSFTDVDEDEIRAHQRRAYRWTFLVSGLRHPNFVRIVDQVTTKGAGKIAAAAQALSV
jgi:P-aminobenzoate N-oxygenase AurF